MRRHKFPRSNLICRIDVTAFLAVQLAMLVFFWPLTPHEPRTARNLPVDLPRVDRLVLEQKAIREDALFIGITRDGAIWFDQDRVRADDLHARIRDRLIQGAEPKIYFKVDQRARYGDFVQALDAVRSAGLQDIAFIAEQRRKPLQIKTKEEPRASKP